MRAIAVFIGAMLACLPGSALAQQCDRACLEAIVENYLQAMLANDTSGLPLANDVKFAENGVRLAPGQGSFATIDGLGAYRHVYADPATGNVAAITTITEHGAPAMLDLRLRVVDGGIAEIETLYIRDPGGHARYEAMRVPDAAWLDEVPASRRLGRDEMVRLVNRYFTAMVRNDGRADYTFLHPDCDRLEHGLRTTSLPTRAASGHSQDTGFRALDCRSQFGMGFPGFVTDLRDRRFLVLDEERQTVLAMVHVDHDGTVRERPLGTGNSFVLPPYYAVPRGLLVMEGFKLKDGMIYRIETTLIETPYGAAPPWDAAADLVVVE